MLLAPNFSQTWRYLQKVKYQIGSVTSTGVNGDDQSEGGSEMGEEQPNRTTLVMKWVRGWGGMNLKCTDQFSCLDEP